MDFGRYDGASCTHTFSSFFLQEIKAGPISLVPRKLWLVNNKSSNVARKRKRKIHDPARLAHVIDISNVTYEVVQIRWKSHLQ